MVPLLQHKQTHFALWRPSGSNPALKLIIGKFKPGHPASLANEQTFDMSPSAISPDLFEIAATSCHLQDGEIYHYWFEVLDNDVYVKLEQPLPLRITDPAAYSVDWRLTFVFPAPYNRDPTNQTENEAPATVVHFKNGKLLPADPLSRPPLFDDAPDASMADLPTNNRLVIYELPTAWTKSGDLLNAANVGVGTFRDVLALIEKNEPGAHFTSIPEVAQGRHLIELGINALELLPPADTFQDRKSWGYGTSNYFAPDFDLGRPLDLNASAAVNEAKPSTAVTDLLTLIRACHKNKIRFFYDAVMAFSKQDPYRFINFLDFHIKWDSGDPEQDCRDGFGGDLWKYVWNPQGYDPVTGDTGQFYLARRHMISHILHWMNVYHVDGLRLDSVNNYNNWDFAGQVRDESRKTWKDRWSKEGNAAGANERFLVVGEELAVPKPLLGKIDALWNEDFKRILRSVILGRHWDTEPSFEWSVRKLIDCRNLGFSDGSQAVNYIGSHDVGGFGNERFYNYLENNGVLLKDKPIKLAFACLLTAVGIPMILAGDEFAEQSNFQQVNDTNKETDAINYQHVAQPWRKSIFDYVSILVKLRTTSPALAVNDTDFIHVDFTEGKRVLVWKRGRAGIDDPVVVVANFSDWGTAHPQEPNARYDVPNWPQKPVNKQWHEITQNRNVPENSAGHEPLFPWEAKVYILR